MTQVELKIVTAKKVLFILRKNGCKVAQYEVARDSDKAQAKMAKDAGVDIPTVLVWLDAAPGTWDLGGPASGFSVWLRGIKEPRKDVTQYPDAAAFLASFTGPRELLAEWDDVSQLGCLDVDYHGGTVPPSPEWIDTTVRTKLLPQPALWHLTPRGFHAFYTPTDRLRGDEIAALAALRWRSIDGTSGVEVKRQVRCPGDYPVIRNHNYGKLETYVTDWLASKAETDPSEWLETNGFEMHNRYPHNRCPIEPTDADNRDPVVVTESGIYCHRCAGLGRSIGRSRPGFFPYPGSNESGVIGDMVRNKTHWGHAGRVIQASLNFTGPIAKLAYSAALKLQHGDNDGVFNPVVDSLVRLHPGRWATVEEGYTFTKNIEPLLRILPVTEGDPAKVCLLSQPTLDLSSWGYPEVDVLRGGRLSTIHLDSSRLLVSQPSHWLKEYGTTFHPRYVEPGTRMDEAKAKGIIESVLPGVDWTYTTLLLMARGCRELQVGLPQHILVEGRSQTGKTAHVQLVAGILGDVVTPVEATVDQDRFRSGIRDASEKGSFLGLDEFLKTSLRLNPKLTYEQVFEPLLNFDPESLSHKLYAGPSALGRIGVCVWTDTDFPPVLHDYTQVARRVHCYKLSRVIQWDASLAANGISEVRKIRTLSQDHADACNSILSYVADRYFRVPQTFHQLCPQIGVTTLQNSEDFLDMSGKRRDFFDAVCEAPELGKSDANRWPGRGYKLILRGGDDRLSELWAGFSDGGKFWDRSKRLKEKPFTFLDENAELDILPSHGPRLAVRFRVGPMRNPTKVNREILQGNG